MTRIGFIAGLLLVAWSAALPFYIMGGNGGEPAPAPHLPKCPPMGAIVADSVVTSHEEWASGIFPIGRPFVVVRCER